MSFRKNSLKFIKPSITNRNNSSQANSLNESTHFQEKFEGLDEHFNWLIKCIFPDFRRLTTLESVENMASSSDDESKATDIIVSKKPRLVFKEDDDLTVNGS